MELNGDEVREDLQGATVDAVCSLHPRCMTVTFGSSSGALQTPDNATAVDWDTHWFSLDPALGVPGLWKDEEPGSAWRDWSGHGRGQRRSVRPTLPGRTKAKQPPTKDPPPSKPKASDPPRPSGASSSSGQAAPAAPQQQPGSALLERGRQAGICPPPISPGCPSSSGCTPEKPCTFPEPGGWPGSGPGTRTAVSPVGQTRTES